MVEVAPNATPPVCKVMDFGKFKYEQDKKEKLAKKKRHEIVVKEIRLRPKTEEHDFNFKLKHAREFLLEGNKVKVTLIFRGREMAHVDYGKRVIERFKQEIEDIAKVEREPVLEGRNMIMYLIKK